MFWLEAPVIESLGLLIAAAKEPTNPASITLALVGVITFISFQLFARPGHALRRTDEIASQSGPPPAEAEPAAEDRRVA